MIKVKSVRKILVICCLILVLFGLWQIKSIVFAETSGSSPESGASSRIKTSYDWLVAKGANYGATDAVDWDSAVTYPWGTYWNRIMESAAWEPDGTATAGAVFLGKTFYAGNNDRTIKTGTYDPATSLYLPQSLVEWDDYKTGDETGEESSWNNPATNVWTDGRTGLYWSNSLGQYSNIFPDTTHTTCPFFSSTPRGSYDGLNANCGNAINACGTLSLAVDGGAAKTDWYLPSQKELMQAYIDGMYNQAGSTFTTTGNFWSSTEVSSGATNAWRVSLSTGYTGTSTKVTATYYVRCVRGD